MTTTEEVVTIVILEPDEGKWLTDGESYSQKVYLPQDADPSVWTEVADADLPEDAVLPAPPPEEVVS